MSSAAALPPWLREPRGPVFRGERVTIGRFRRHPSEPDFSHAGLIDTEHVVFPRLPVRIAQAGRRTVVADSTVAMLYNRGQEYRRSPISPDGDRGDWFAFRAAEVREALGGGQFHEPCVPAPMAVVLQARELFAAATRAADPLAVEEAALGLLRALLLRPSRAGRAPRSWVDLAEVAREKLARRFTQRVTLSQLGLELGCSPFHLCRAFSAASGSTLHRHLTALRLHASLERVPERRGDLAGLALDLGFSHHAHFTAAFRRAYGLTPQAWAARLRHRATSR